MKWNKIMSGHPSRLCKVTFLIIIYINTFQKKKKKVLHIYVSVSLRCVGQFISKLSSTFKMKTIHSNEFENVKILH